MLLPKQRRCLSRSICSRLRHNAGVKTFTATLEKQAGLGWTIARLPFDPAVEWPEKVRLRVRGSMHGLQFRTSLFPGGDGPGSYYLLVNKAMQQAAGASEGGTVTISLEPDLQPRPAELPAELDALLDDEAGLREWYESLSEYTRREIGKWVQDVKSHEAKARRARQMAERLFFTMEAERELPPAVARALKARPRATAGWAKMTPTQRRMELFAVAYYQTPEASVKRIAKLCDEAEKRAPEL